MRQIKSCVGPLAGDIDALATFMKTIVDAQPWKLDSTVIDIPWRDVKIEGNKKLRIGVMAEDPALPLQPPIRNALQEAAAKLTAAGHEIIQLQPSDCRFYEGIQTAMALFLLDPTGMRTVLEAGEPPIPSIAGLQSGFAALPMAYLADLKDLEGLARLSALNRKRSDIIRSWHGAYTRHNLDAAIGPILQHTAAEHDLMGSPAYGTTINLIDVIFFVSQYLIYMEGYWLTDFAVSLLRYSFRQGNG